MRIHRAFACVVTLGLAGCATGAHEALSKTQREAVAVEVSVRSASLWDDVKPALHTDFSITEAAALSAADGVQSTSIVQNASEILANLGVSLPTLEATRTQTRTTDALDATKNSDSTATTRTRTSGATDVTASAGAAPAFGGSLKPDEKLSNDPFLRVQTARDLVQWYALLNHDIDAVALDEGYVAYLVRLQVTVAPTKRLQPYDVTLDFATIPGGRIATKPAAQDLAEALTVIQGSNLTERSKSAAQALYSSRLTLKIPGLPIDDNALKLIDPHTKAENRLTKEEDTSTRQLVTRLTSCRELADQDPTRGLRVVPLLVTDQLESTEQQAADLAAARLGFSAKGGFSALGFNFGGGSSTQSLQEALTHRSNSLYSLSRLNDSTLRVRFGAKYLGKNYEAVALNHMVTLVVMVPLEWVDKDDTSRLCSLEFAGRILVTNVHDGVSLPESPDAGSIVGAAKAYSEFELAGAGKPDVAAARRNALLGLAARGDVDSFELVALEPICRPNGTILGNDAASPISAYTVWASVSLCSRDALSQVDPHRRSLARALYIDFVRAIDRDLVAANVPLPAWRHPQWPRGDQTVFAANSDGGVVARAVGGRGLDPDHMEALLTGISFEDSATAVSIPASKITFDGKTLGLSFPALAGLGDVKNLKLGALSVVVSSDHPAGDRWCPAPGRSSANPNDPVCSARFATVLTNPKAVSPDVAKLVVDSADLVSKDGDATGSIVLTFTEKAPNVRLTASGDFSLKAVAGVDAKVASYDADELTWVVTAQDPKKKVKLDLTYANAKPGGKGTLTAAPVDKTAPFQAVSADVKIAPAAK